MALPLSGSNLICLAAPRVSVRGAVSDKFDLWYGVPQGLRLGPLLFTVYASALFDVVEK